MKVSLDRLASREACELAARSLLAAAKVEGEPFVESIVS